MKITIEVHSGSSVVRECVSAFCDTANPSSVCKAVSLGVDSFLAREEDAGRKESAAIARELVADLEALQKKWRAKEDAWEAVVVEGAAE